MIEITDALAAFRITRFITADKLGGVIRAPIIAMAYSARDGGLSPEETAETSVHYWDERVEADDDPPTAAAFIVCPWCVGMWVAAGVVVARRVLPNAWGPTATALAFSAVSGLLAQV